MVSPAKVFPLMVMQSVAFNAAQRVGHRLRGNSTALIEVKLRGIGRCFDETYQHSEICKGVNVVEGECPTANGCIFVDEESFEKSFEKEAGKPLGAGLGGEVVTVVHNLSKTKHAQKRYSLAGASHDRLQDIAGERNAMVQLDHPNIVKLHHSFSTSGYYYFVMDLLLQGEKPMELFDAVKQGFNQPDKSTWLGKVKTWMYQIGSALQYMHESVMLIHRDIKLENVMIHNNNAMLVDFGFATSIEDGPREES